MSSLRILHFADLHLDASFAGGTLPAAVGAWRRADLRATLGRILALARERRVDAVTIGGDLYEQDYTLPDTADFLVQQFARLAPIRVFIAPGNSDPHTGDSLYALTRWPENVTIFPQGRLTPIELAPNMHLWGMGYPLSRERWTIDRFRVDRRGMNLLLMHAAATHRGERGAPSMALIHPSFVREAGFDLALLGGEHNGYMWPDEVPCCVYPGSPEPLAPGEAGGNHHIVFLTIADGRPVIERLPISQWQYWSRDIDLTGVGSVEAAAMRVEQVLRDGDHERAIWTVTLLGLPNFDMNVAVLAEHVTTKAHIQYEVRLALPYDLDQLAWERTVRGLLAQRFQTRLSAARNEQERYLALYALHAALRALEGKREPPYEVG